jgi:hypothetical protein
LYIHDICLLETHIHAHTEATSNLLRASRCQHAIRSNNSIDR